MRPSRSSGRTRCRRPRRSPGSAHRCWLRAIAAGRSPDRTNPRARHWGRASSVDCACRWSDRSPCIPSRTRPARQDRGTRPCSRPVSRRSSGRVGGFRGQAIGAQREVEFVRLALVLQPAARPKIGVIVEVVERREQHELVDVLAVQRSVIARHHGAPRPADQRDLLHAALGLDVVHHRRDVAQREIGACHRLILCAPARPWPSRGSIIHSCDSRPCRRHSRASPSSRPRNSPCRRGRSRRSTGRSRHAGTARRCRR